MTWARRFKRVFAIEIEKCEKCGGNVQVIACIEDPEVVEKSNSAWPLETAKKMGKQCGPDR